MQTITNGTQFTQTPEWETIRLFLDFPILVSLQTAGPMIWYYKNKLSSWGIEKYSVQDSRSDEEEIRNGSEINILNASKMTLII